MSENDFPSLKIWKRAIDFYKRQWPIIPFVLPFIFIPIFTDYLHSELVRQDRTNNGVVNLPSALLKASKGFFPLLRIKIQFMFVATLWSIIPVVGWFRDLDYRLNWAMASNVLVFENLIGGAARRRCIELQRNLDRRKAIRTLLIIPGTLDLACLMILTVGVTFVESNLFFWIPMMATFVIDLPLSATVNTLFYLSANKTVEQASPETAHSTNAAELENFCPNCVHLQETTGVCEVGFFNVVEYPRLFQSKCNGRYFEKME